MPLPRTMPGTIPGMIPVLAIAGPTAAGKSALALEVCARWPDGAEIVSVDSAQVYRGMDIGTAKPDAVIRAAVPHHLIDLLDPAQPYSAARFAADAQAAVAGIRARGHLPVLVGGTLLYYRALFEGLSDLPAADAAVRARLAEQARALGWPAMHQRLVQVDPATAARLHPNDAQRIQRALEIFEVTGQPASARFGRTSADSLPGPLVQVAVVPPQREILHRRIAQRFGAMLRGGLVEEVRRLHARPDLSAHTPSMRAVGYRQVWQHLDGDCSLDEAVDRGIAATRQYAKRQLTWLRSEPQWRWIDPAEPNASGVVLNLVNQRQA